MADRFWSTRDQASTSGTAPAPIADAASVLRALPDPVIVTDLHGRITHWNAAAEQLLGWDATEAVGRDWSELGVAPSSSPDLDELNRTVRLGKVWEGSLTLTSSQDRPVILGVRAAPLSRDDGEVTAVVIAASELAGLWSNAGGDVAGSGPRARAAARATLLSRAGMLLGTSLDVGRTLSAIAELLVPSFADHCVVDLLDDSRVLRRAVTVHADDPLPPTARLGVGSQSGESDQLDSIDYPADHPCARALASGRPVLVSRDGLGAAERSAFVDQDIDNHDVLLDAYALIAVPLLGPSGGKGVLAIAASGGQRGYDAADVELLEELAARAGLALENAALYDRKRSLAITLQHSLLPDRLPQVDGLTIAVGYDPAADSDVGGDLYDVVPLSAGRVGIVIGDVQGRGPHAAAVMGQLRAAMRAYALLDLEPARLLACLDELVRGLNEALLVTCVYAVYDPFTRRCLLATAGHPPPLLASADGCFPIEVPPDVPLGVGGAAYHDHVFTVPAGDTMVLYTDGVVERRDQAVDEGVRSLCEVLERLPREPYGMCRATLRAAGGPADDDQAVLAMRTSWVDLPISRLVLSGRPEAALAARQHVRGTLAEWGLKQQIEVAELLVSELVANAVRHAVAPHPPAVPSDTEDDELSLFLGTLASDDVTDAYDELGLLDGIVPEPDPSHRVELSLRRGQRALWIEVYDPDVRLPRLRAAEETDEGGRGLYLVDTLSSRWGTRATRSGKLVWFELPID